MKIRESTNPFDSCWDARFEMFKRLNDFIKDFCTAQGIPEVKDYTSESINLIHNTSSEIGNLIKTRSTDFDV
jgi:hypothetical protein